MSFYERGGLGCGVAGLGCGPSIGMRGLGAVDESFRDIWARQASDAAAAGDYQTANYYQGLIATGGGTGMSLSPDSGFSFSGILDTVGSGFQKILPIGLNTVQSFLGPRAQPQPVQSSGPGVGTVFGVVGALGLLGLGLGAFSRFGVGGGSRRRPSRRRRNPCR